MKLKKIISLVSSVAIACTMFTSLAQAKTENKNAKITVDAGIDSYNYYYVDILLNSDETLGLTTTVDGRTTYYSGNGIYALAVTLKGITKDDIYVDAPIASSAITVSNNLTEQGFEISGYAATAKEQGGNGNPSTLLRISTNYAENSMTKNQVIAKFSDFGYTSIKISNVPEKSAGSYAIPLEKLTTYAVGDDGYTEHVDADYALVTPKTPTSTVKDAVKGKTINGSQMFSTSEAITMPEGVDDVTVTITNDKVTDKTIEETVGKNTNVLGSGTTKFIPIVSYKIGDTSLKGSIFTIKVTNGSSNLGTWTYTVPTE